jgi:hypothetical protein
LYVREFKPVILDGIHSLGCDTWPAGQSIWSADIEARALAVDQMAVSRPVDGDLQEVRHRISGAPTEASGSRELVAGRS